MEDFGYSKGQKQNDDLATTKKIFLIGASLFSLACFIYITINAYDFIKGKTGEVETIKSPQDPLKVDEAVTESQTNSIDHSVYDDIFGNKKESIKNITPKIRENIQPAIPPKIKDLEKEEIIADEIKQNPAAKPAVSQENSKAKEEVKKQTTQKTETKTENKKPKEAKNKKKIIKIQMAAMASKKSADDYWVKLNDLHDDLFSDLTPYIEEVDLGKRGIFYRLQVGNFFNQVDAEKFCKKYIAKTHKTRADCIIVE